MARILQLLPIQRKPNADEWLGEGTVEVIYLNRLIDSVLIKLLATLLFIKKLNETQLSHLMPPPGECLRHIGPADAMVVVVVVATKTQHTTNF